MTDLASLWDLTEAQGLVLGVGAARVPLWKQMCATRTGTNPKNL